MNSRSLFKLVVYLLNWIKITVFAFPVAAAITSLKQGKLKYGYDFFEVNHNWSIMIAIAISLTLNTWHAMSFEELKNYDLKQYLKVKQRYKIVGSEGWTIDNLQKALEGLTVSNRYWKALKRSKPGLWLGVKNKYGFQDVVHLTKTEDGFIVESKPRFLVDFVDMGRNLKNVQFLSKHLKEILK